ncbi:MAG: NAD(P)H-dependent oxidoreductase [Burkholderia sp.]|jgi:FMN-dependent NADH-azoreductase|uniref:FMN-dependent NADH-azoreductase n=1 Tax=Burkholderia TaxID=32008 RepID=UPI00158B68A8|nr:MULTISPECIES: NAD(P)H-dependent oxidoreductase [Burkholderia]MCA3779136.1 NAD(P)H-dependent oxidoreductase [Burkholderia sp.]MCA3783671.1 NAD(P)H-dependent oxidoreductase [Burkholderia sp.]MCA3797145.1 NAD(P)H-dependent oxidoreductase [Burkholderia sp.]MCA3802869.1 NAD(P)H-dependent oxidoreductase [Burkholderia sp.]MCA3812106.1 NAD(P)H-dependent oxidoreductase [Burkholderia sp.]
MARILALKSSINGNQSQTATLIDTFLAQRQANGHTDEVIVRDLVGDDLPVLDSELFHALRGAENPGERAQQAIALSDKLIAELKRSDLLLIGAPMYNHNVPTQLKNWFDLVARARVTFRYTETYPMGLVEGVSAIVFSSRGGVHVGEATDAVTPYLRAVLGLMGIVDVEFVYAEGLDMKPHGFNAGLENARRQMAALHA